MNNIGYDTRNWTESATNRKVWRRMNRMNERNEKALG